MSARNPVLRALEQGRKEGRAETRQKVLDFLDDAYMNPSVKRGTQRAEDILTLVRELMEVMTK